MDRPLVVSALTLQTLMSLSSKDKSSIIGLYMYYYHKSISENTHQLHVSLSQTSEDLKIGRDRIRRMRKVLEKIGLIHRVIVKGKKGQVKRWYIEVFYEPNPSVVSKVYRGYSPDGPIESIGNKCPSSKKVPSPEPTLLKSRRVLTTSSKTPLRGSSSLTTSYGFGENREILSDHRNLLGEVTNGTLPFDEKLCKHLLQHLQSKRRIMRHPNLKQWIKQLHTFRTRHEVSKDRIYEVLKWYVLHIDEPYVPVAYSIKTFCDKFLQIENAMFRQEGPSSPTTSQTRKTTNGEYETHIRYEPR